MPQNNFIQNYEQPLAVSAALTAFVCWGLFGLYFKALEHINPIEILAHRIVWSLVFLAIIITALKKWGDIFDVLKSPKKLSLSAICAVMITTNWGVYIYCVVSGQALEGSMGYFMMPIAAFALAAVFLSERLNKVQMLAIGLVVIGVAYKAATFGDVPWLALTLAISFSLYGLLRKKAPMDALVGLCIETFILSPLAIGYMIFLALEGQLAFVAEPIEMQLFLMLAGPITALPLILFTYGARKLRYTTVSLLQYLNPTCQFLLAIFIFKEGFALSDVVTFGFIWFGLFVYSQDILRKASRPKHAVS